MKFLKVCGTLIVLATLTACGGLGVKELNQQGEGRILNKASFYLKCEKQELKLQCINNDLNNAEVCSEFGVTGCGNKAIYTNIGKTWIMTASKSL